MARDFTKALDWLITNVLKSSPPRHKRKYSPGGQQGPRGPQQLRGWLANAMAWADQEFAGKRYRWTVHAVLQTIAFYALVAGEQRSGTWLVGVGGRTLSLGCGLLSEDTIWRVLADLRERAGAPLVLVRQHIGTEADVYALTSQNKVTSDPARAERVRIEPVHEAWIVLGPPPAPDLRTRRPPRPDQQSRHLRGGRGAPRHRRRNGHRPGNRRSAHPIGLGNGCSTDPNHSTTIADRHHLHETRDDRMSRHRAERAAWRTWLAERERLRGSNPSADDPPADTAGTSVGRRGPDDEQEYAAWLESVMATGPPDDRYHTEREAIDMIAELLGGRIVAA